MKLAITGSNGFIGTNLCRRLEELNISFIRIGHTARLSEIAEEFKSFRPDALVHLASVFISDHKPEEIDLLVDSNVGFGVRILEACRLAEVPSVVITGSTWQHFGAKVDVPVNLYGALKNGVETAARYYSDAKGLSIAYLKLYDSFGPNDSRAKLVPHLLKLRKAALGGSQAQLDLSAGEQIVDFTSVENTIDALLAGIEWTKKNPGEFQSFRVSGREAMSLKEFVTLFERVGGVALGVRWGARPYREREVMQPWSDGPEIPGYAPRVSLLAGLTRLIDGEV